MFKCALVQLLLYESFWGGVEVVQSQKQDFFPYAQSLWNVHSDAAGNVGWFVICFIFVVIALLLCCFVLLVVFFPNSEYADILLTHFELVV